jgi:hypothetical protein
MEQEPKYYVMNAEGRSDPFETVDDALRRASHDDRQGRIPISVCCIERGCGRIVYTARELRTAIEDWRKAHPGE